MILVAVGTYIHGFDELVAAADAAAAELGLAGFAQIGHSRFVPRQLAWERFLTPAQMANRMTAAHLVICHGGVGLLGEAMRAQHGSSESHFASVLPDAVVFAHSTEDVVALVKACTAAGVPIIPFGAGTSVEGNTTPVRGGISLDLSEMNKIVAINPDDFDCTV